MAGGPEPSRAPSAPLSPADWRRAERAVDAALDAPPALRAAVLEAQCGDDPAIHAAARAWLRACDDGDADDRRDLAHSAAVQPGTILGRWRLLREVGRGGMGVVFVAAPVDAGPPDVMPLGSAGAPGWPARVAVKVVRDAPGANATWARRLEEERRILASLAHPGIARLLDSGVTEDGLPWFAMEYVDGERVDVWCDARALSVDARLALVARVCDAVRHAHARGVVHRDLKPSNVLVSADGTPTLLDFGIAKALAPDRALALTNTGQYVLTPEYASPEQLRGAPATAASDVYAFGVLLYELLVGRRPFDGASDAGGPASDATPSGRTPSDNTPWGRTARGAPAAVLAHWRAALEDDAPAPSTVVSAAAAAERGTTPAELRRRLRGALDAVVLTALRREPECRYPTAAALADDLRRAANGLPVLAPGYDRAYRLRRRMHAIRVRTPRRVVAGVAIVALVGSAWPLAEYAAARLDRPAGPRAAPVAHRPVLAARPLLLGAAYPAGAGATLELDAALSPDGRWIAYAGADAGGMHLYRTPAASGTMAAGARRLTPAGRAYQRAPQWSPDGRVVAFTADRRIWTVGAADCPGADSVPHLLVAPAPGAGWVASPAWAPDGRAIAYVEDDVIQIRAVSWVGHCGVPVIDPTTGPAHALRTAAGTPYALSWSPDGRWLAFASGNAAFLSGAQPWGSPMNVGNAAPSVLWLADTAGRRALPLTDSRALNTAPAWLPDGRGLVFVSNRDGPRDLYELAIDGTGHSAGAAARLTVGLDAHTVSVGRDGRHLAYTVFRQRSNVWAFPLGAGVPHVLTRGHESVEGMALSPDGRQLAFDSDRDGVRALYLVGATPRDDGALASPVRVTAGGDDFMPHWSPDGRELAFYRIDASGARLLATVPAAPAAGSTLPVPRGVVAASWPHDQWYPSWSPDGRSLVFHSYRDLLPDLYVVTRLRDGTPGSAWTAPRQLTTGGGADARWSPDGRRIAYWRHDGLWTVAPDGRAPVRLVALDTARAGAAGTGAAGTVQWSPDGAVLYYKWIDGDGGARIWVVPRTGGVPHPVVQLTVNGQGSPRPEFATDGQRVYAAVAVQEASVWTVVIGAAPH